MVIVIAECEGGGLWELGGGEQGHPCSAPHHGHEQGEGGGPQHRETGEAQVRGGGESCCNGIPEDIEKYHNYYALVDINNFSPLAHFLFLGGKTSYFPKISRSLNERLSSS